MAAPEPDSSAVMAFWERCKRELPQLVSEPEPESWAFGDSAEMANELSALVVAGTKRATAGLLAGHEAEREPLPEPGDLSIVVDGDGQPVCLIKTTDVRVGSLESVDDQFAWDEGEGDRTRSYWLREHRAFFARVVTALGIDVPADPDTVFERFEVLFPR